MTRYAYQIKEGKVLVDAVAQILVGQSRTQVAMELGLKAMPTV